jgi:hypothetical protein
MPYNYWWEIEKHVLYVSYSGDISVDEFARALKEIEDEIRLNGGPFVNMISDMRNVRRQLSLPEVMNAIRRFDPPDQLGWTLNVGDSNALLRFTTNVAGQFLNRRARSFDTPEEALAFLREMDTSIEWESEDED